MNDLDKRKKKYSEKMIEFNLEDIPKELADCTWGIKEEKTDVDILMQRYLEICKEFGMFSTDFKIQNDGSIFYTFPIEDLKVKLQDDKGNLIATNFTEGTLEEISCNNITVTNDEISLDNQITIKMKETRTKEQVIFNIVSPQYNIDDQLVFEIDYFTKNGIFELQRLGTRSTIKDYSLDKVIREFYGDFSEELIKELKYDILKAIDNRLQFKTEKLSNKLTQDMMLLSPHEIFGRDNWNPSPIQLRCIHYKSTNNIYY